MTLQFVAAEMRTGAIIADLPSLDVDYPLKHTLSNYDSASAHLNLNGAPENWQRAVQEGGSWIACYDDADTTATIQWCGFVVVNTCGIKSDVVDLSLATAEAYADRRFIGDVTHTTAEGRNNIFASTVAYHIADSLSAPGIPLIVDSDGLPGPTPAADLVWQNTDNASVLTRWNQLIGQLGGEFTVDWQWVTLSGGAQGLQAVLRVGDRIGTPASPGLDPAVTFGCPGILDDLQRVKDYSAGRGANSVTAYSSGQGDFTPYAAPVLAADFQDRPTFEMRYQPAPSIDPAGLAQYAQQAIRVLAPGARAVTLTASLARITGRRYGSDWRLGDDIGYTVGSVDNDGRRILAFPDGLTGTGRAIAVAVTDTNISPILAENAVYSEV